MNQRFALYVATGLASLGLLASCTTPATSDRPETDTADTALTEAPETAETAETTAEAPASPATEAPASTATTIQETKEPPVYAEEGVAIQGYDPVAYFEVGQPVAGDRQFEYEWQGATWRFSSAENRDLFASDPEQYAPQYGGYCAWAVSQGYIAPIDPAAWAVVDGKLYLNYDQSVQARWQRDVPGNIAKADANWPQVLN